MFSKDSFGHEFRSRNNVERLLHFRKFRQTRIFENSSEEDKGENIPESQEDRVMEVQSPKESIEIDPEQFQDDMVEDDRSDSDSRLQNLLTTNDNKMRAYTLFILNNGISRSTSSEVDSLMMTLYGYRPPITSQAVWKIVNDSSHLVEQTLLMCRGCGRSLTDNHICTHLQCPNFLTPPSSMSELSPSITYFYDVKNQLRVVLNAKLPDIIRHHHKLHQGDITNDEGSRIRNSPIYRRNIETKEEYEKNKLKLPVILFHDGARYKNSQRIETTPIIIRIEGLSRENVHDTKYLLLVALNASKSGITSVTSPTIFNRVVMAMKDLQQGTIVFSNGIPWFIELVPIGLLSDYKGHHLLSPVPSWQKQYGCMTCEIPGTKIGRRISFASLDRFPRRTLDSIRNDIGTSSKGFEKCEELPPIYSIFDPSQFCHDPFHLMEEGILKYAAEETLAPKGPKKFTFSHLKKGRLDAIDDCLKNMKPYTHMSAFPSSFSNTQRTTGTQMRMTFTIAFLLLGIDGSFESPQFSIFILALGTISNILKRKSLRDIEYIVGLTEKVHMKFASGWCTLKLHGLFHHLVEQIRDYGYDMDGKFFERLHSHLQSLVPKHDVNVLSAGKRFLVLNRLSMSISEQNRNEPSVTFKGTIPLQKLSEEQCIILRQFHIDSTKCKFFKTIELPSPRTKRVFGSNMFSTLKKSTNSFVKCLNGGDLYYGRVDILFCYNGEPYTLLTRYTCNPVENMFSKLRYSLNSIQCQESLDLLDSIISVNQGIHEINGKGLFVTKITDLFPILILPFENRVFLMEIN